MNKKNLWHQTYQYLHDYYTNKDYKHILNIAQRLHLPYPLDLFPRATNLAQSTYYMKRKSKTANKRIFDKLKQLPTDYVKFHLFTELITFPDQSTISKSEVKKINQDLSKLRLKQKRNGINTLIASNEALLDKDQNINQHAHGLILTSSNASTTELTNYYTHWLNQYQKSNHNYQVVIKKFKITKSTLKSSIKAFIRYLLKQYRLPILKTKSEQWNYEKLPKFQRREFLHELINAYKYTRTAYIIPTNAKLQVNWTELATYIIKDIITLKHKKSGSQSKNDSHINNTYSTQITIHTLILVTMGNIVTNGRSSGIPP